LLRLLEGAAIYQISRNRRPNVEMIEKYYAAQLKTELDAAGMNIMRPHPKNDDFQERPWKSGGGPLGRGSLDQRRLLYDEVVAIFLRAWRNGRRSGLKQP
jgi:hypothetical protein